MPRRARVLLPGVTLHLIQRGNNRSACFFSEEDYLFYLEHLADQARKHDCAIHAWCLMTNQKKGTDLFFLIFFSLKAPWMEDYL